MLRNNAKVYKSLAHIGLTLVMIGLYSSYLMYVKKETYRDLGFEVANLSLKIAQEWMFISNTNAIELKASKNDLTNLCIRECAPLDVTLNPELFSPSISTTNNRAAFDNIFVTRDGAYKIGGIDIVETYVSQSREFVGVIFELSDKYLIEYLEKNRFLNSNVKYVKKGRGAMLMIVFFETSML